VNIKSILLVLHDGSTIGKERCGRHVFRLCLADRRYKIAQRQKVDRPLLAISREKLRIKRCI
jgi:hypothetical protein